MYNLHIKFNYSIGSSCHLVMTVTRVATSQLVHPNINTRLNLLSINTNNNTY